MVKIRLKRQGRKKKPFYRIVVTDIRTRRNGKPLEELGYYNPHSKELKLDKAKAQEWLSKGAIPSETAERLIKHASDAGELVYLPKREPKPKAAPAAPVEEAKAEEPKVEEAKAGEAKAEEA